MKHLPIICAALLVCAWALAATVITTVTQADATNLVILQALEK